MTLHAQWSAQSGLWVLRGKLQLHSGLFKCYLTSGGRTQKQMVYISLLGITDITLPSPR